MTAFPCHLISWIAAIYILYCCNYGTRVLMFQTYIKILHSMYPSSCPTVFAIAVVILCSIPLSEAHHEVLKHYFFMGWSSHAPNPQPVGSGYPLFVGHHLWPVQHGHPASSCTNTSTAVRIIWSCKPQHYVKVRIPLGGFHSVPSGKCQDSTSNWVWPLLHNFKFIIFINHPTLWCHKVCTVDSK